MSEVLNKTTAPGSEPADPKEERKAEPAVAAITKEIMPETFIDRIKKYPSRKLPPLEQEVIELFDEFFPDEPEYLARQHAHIIHWNEFVDLEQDCLRQHAERGYAEVGVEFSKGYKQLFILPQHHQPPMEQQDNATL